MLTMREIRAKNYNIFRDASEERQERQARALKYIEHLGISTGTNLNEMAPLHIFSDPTGPWVLEDKNQINSTFFKWRETIKQETAAPPDVISESLAKNLCKTLDVVYRKGIDKIIKNYDQRIHDREESIHNYMDSIAQDERAITDANILKRASIERKAKGTGISNDLLKVLADGWWRLSDSPVRDKISLITPRITLSYFKDKAAISTIVDLGFIQIDIGTDGSILFAKAQKYDANPLRSEYYHPHIKTDGFICWGSELKQYTALQKEFNLVGMLELIKVVLTNYNHESPYIHLWDLENSAQTGQIFRRSVEIAKLAEIRKVFEDNRFTPPFSAEEIQAFEAKRFAEMLGTEETMDIGNSIFNTLPNPNDDEDSEDDSEESDDNGSEPEESYEE